MKKKWKFWSFVLFLLTFATFVDFLAYIVVGAGIGELLGGTSSPVVIAIADHLGESVWLFVLMNVVAVVSLAYLMAATFMASKEGERS